MDHEQPEDDGPHVGGVLSSIVGTGKERERERRDGGRVAPSGEENIQ